MELATPHQPSPEQESDALARLLVKEENTVDNDVFDQLIAQAPQERNAEGEEVMNSGRKVDGSSSEGFPADIKDELSQTAPVTKEEKEVLPKTPPKELKSPAVDQEKDYSQLLAEFHDDSEGLDTVQDSTDIEGDVAGRHGLETDVLVTSGLATSDPNEVVPTGPTDNVTTSSPTHQNALLLPPTVAAALFADDPTFDTFLPIASTEPAELTSDPPSPSPVPSLSIEHSGDISYTDREPDAAGDVSVQSLFSNASDWLADTTMDDSFAVGGEDPVEYDQPGKAEGNQVIPLEVPEGWYDENGEWQWYTDEDREQVRLAMLSQAKETNLPGSGLQESTAIFSPTDHPGISENAARRTPQPDSAATFPEQPSYDPYVPPAQSPYAPATQNAAYSPSVNSSANYFSTTTSYQPAATASAVSPYAVPAGGASPYNPYAPTASSQLSPYTTTSPNVGYSAQQAGPSQLPRPPKTEPPKPPQRMTSTAYDPPFLRPQKSFVRPPSAVPTPAPFLASSTLSPPQAVPPVPTAPPPSGPPRRAKAERKPSFVQSPPNDLNRSQTYASSGSGAAAQNTFDPPLRPSSTHLYSVSGGSSRIQGIQPEASYNSSHVLGVPSGQYNPHQNTQVPSRPPSVQHQQNGFRSPGRNLSPPFLAFSASSEPQPAGPRYTSPVVTSSGPPRVSSPMYEARSPLHSGLTTSPHRPGADQQERRGSSWTLSPPGEHQNSHELHANIATGTKKGQVGQEPSVLSGFESEVEVDPEGGEWREEDAARSRDAAPGYAPPRSFSPQISQDHSTGATLESAHDDYGHSSLGLQQMQQSPYSAHAPLDYAPNSFVAPPFEKRDPASRYDKAHQDRNIPQPDQYGSQSQSNFVSSHSDNTRSYNAYEPHTQNTEAPVYLQDSSNYSSSPYSPYDTAAPNSVPDSGSTEQQPGLSSYDPSPYAPSSQPQPISFSQPADPYNRIQTPAYGSDYGVSPQAPNYFRSPALDDTYVPLQVAEQRPVSEDPLGRCSIDARNAPLAIFGFGGLLITAFPAGADVAASIASGSQTHARKPSYGYASHRGQLWIRNVSDVVAPSALKSHEAVFPGPLVLDPATPKSIAADKKKREAVMAYLEARADEIEKGLPFLRSSASLARREEEGKLVLVRLLSAMLIGDGKFFGSPKAEDAVRLAFQSPSSSAPSTVAMPSSIRSPKSNGFTSSLYPSKATIPATATPAQLETLSAMLLGGDKRDAALYAADAGLWSHALVISSGVDPDLWKEIVLRFSQAELGSLTAKTAAMKASYAIFSGTTTSSADDLFNAATITGDPSADQWREVISAVIFNGKSSDWICLDDLGNKLSSAGLRCAAHACHLLSPASPFAEATIAAFDRAITLVEDVRDEDGIIFAEIGEYARSLVPSPKGLEPPFPGLPQLLPYKLQRAWQAAELGDLDQAQRYCTAVEQASKIGKTGLTHLPRNLAASLEDLVERLTGTPSPNPARIIGGRKQNAKPGLDKLGSWIEGRLTKFIAGDEESETSGSIKAVPIPPIKGGSTGPVGPFSHFSTISSNAGELTRAGSVPDFSIPNGSGSYSVPDSRASPVPRLNPPYGQSFDPSRDSTTLSYGEQIGNGYSASSSYSPWGEQGDHTEGGKHNESATDEGETGYEGEFINPMAALSLNSGPSLSYDPIPKSAHKSAIEEQDDEDLGFGNTSISRARTPRPVVPKGEAPDDASKAQPTKAETPADASPAKSETKPAGWLGKWWGKKEGQPSGPIKAKLGEESSMVFDKELKRWVVKGTKPEAAPSPPPPPPRAQTASPSRSTRPEGPSNPSRASSATPPPSQPPRLSAHPPRTASAPTGFSESVDGGIRRMKSTLQESITAADIPTSSGAPGVGLGGPPTAGLGGPPRPPTARVPSSTASIDDLLSRPPSKRPGSAAAKKGARNRYVDVFQPTSDAA